MAMHWEKFFNDNHINFVSHGPNVRRGNINIRCPFCADDPSEHMGVSLDKEAFGCWRNPQHRGRKAVYLIATLLRCTKGQAGVIAAQYGAADPGDLDEVARAFSEPRSPAKVAQASPLKMPGDFKPITHESGSLKYWKYLAARGFNDVALLVQRFNLRYVSTGRFKDRVIIPIYQEHKLVNWTARALVKPQVAPRYMTLSVNPKDEKEPKALYSDKDVIFNNPSIVKGGKLLLVHEGPFDAMKVDYYGWRMGCRATCTFGLAISDTQIALIAEASRNFGRTMLVHDAGAGAVSLQVGDKLGHYGVEVGSLDVSLKDPGEMTKHQVEEFVAPYI